MGKIKKLINLSLSVIGLGTLIVSGIYATDHDKSSSEVDQLLSSIEEELPKIDSRYLNPEDDGTFANIYRLCRIKGMEKSDSEFMACSESNSIRLFRKKIYDQMIKKGYNATQARAYSSYYTDMFMQGYGISESEERANMMMKSNVLPSKMESDGILMSDLYKKALETYKDERKARIYVNAYLKLRLDDASVKMSKIYADQIVKGRSDIQARKYMDIYIGGLKVLSNKVMADTLARQVVDNERSFNSSLKYVRSYYRNKAEGLGEKYAQKLAEKVAIEAEKEENAKLEECRMPELELDDPSYYDLEDEKKDIYTREVLDGREKSEAEKYVEEYIKIRDSVLLEEYAKLYADRMSKGFSEKDAKKYVYVYIKGKVEGLTSEEAHSKARSILSGRIKLDLEQNDNLSKESDAIYNITQKGGILGEALNDVILDRLEKGSTYKEAVKYVSSIIS